MRLRRHIANNLPLFEKMPSFTLSKVASSRVASAVLYVIACFLLVSVIRWTTTPAMALTIDSAETKTISMNIGEDLTFEGWAFIVKFAPGTDLALASAPNVSISSLSLELPPGTGEGGEQMPPAITQQMGGSELRCPCDNCDPEGHFAGICTNGGQCIWSSSPPSGEEHGPPMGLLPMPAVKESPSVLFGLFAGRQETPVANPGTFTGFKITRNYDSHGGDKADTGEAAGAWQQLVPPSIDPTTCYINFTDGFYVERTAEGQPAVEGISTSEVTVQEAVDECNYDVISTLLDEMLASVDGIESAGKRDMERMVWNFASYEIREGWSGCKKLVDSFVTRGLQERTVLGSTDCTYEWNSAQWLADPCCNHALLLTQCCAPRSQQENVTVITGIQEEAVEATCRTPDASIETMELVIEAEAKAAKCEERAARGGASFDVWDKLTSFHQTCHEEIFGKGGSPPACRVDDDCYTTCNTAQQTCVIPWGNEEAALMSCFADNMHPDVDRHLRKAWGLKGSDSDATFEAAFKANMQDPTCVGRDAWMFADKWESEPVEDCDGYENGPTQHCWCPNMFHDDGGSGPHKRALGSSRPKEACQVHSFVNGAWRVVDRVAKCGPGASGGTTSFCHCGGEARFDHESHVMARATPNIVLDRGLSGLPMSVAREEGGGGGGGPPMQESCWLTYQVPANATACVEAKECNWDPWAQDCSNNPQNPGSTHFCGECHGGHCWEVSQPSSCYGWMPFDECAATGGVTGPWGGDHCIFPNITTKNECQPPALCPPPPELEGDDKSAAAAMGQMAESWCEAMCYWPAETITNETMCTDLGNPSAHWDPVRGLCRRHDLWGAACAGEEGMAWWPGRTWNRGAFATEEACDEGRCDMGHGLTAAECNSTSMCTHQCTTCRSWNDQGACYTDEAPNEMACTSVDGRWEGSYCVFDNLRSATECATAALNTTWVTCAGNASVADGSCAACEHGDAEGCGLPLAIAQNVLQCRVDHWAPCPTQDTCEASGICDDWELENWHANECTTWPRNEADCSGACIFPYTIQRGGWPDCPDPQQDGSIQWTKLGCANRTAVGEAACDAAGGTWHARATSEAECQGHGGGCDEERFWDLTPKDESTCESCGGEYKSIYRWTSGIWRVGQMQSLDWKERSLESVNQWKPALNWTKFHEAIDSVVGNVMATNFKNTVTCKYNLMAAVLKTLACDCGVGGHGNCYDQVNWIPAAEAELFSGQKKTADLGGVVTIKTQADSIDPETDSISFQVSTIPDLSAKLAKDFAEAAGGGGSRRRRRHLRALVASRSLAEPNQWDVVFINNGTKHVGQIIGDPVAIANLTWGAGGIEMCLPVIQERLDVADPAFTTYDFGEFIEQYDWFEPREYTDAYFDPAGPSVCRMFAGPDTMSFNDAAIIRFSNTSTGTGVPTTAAPTTGTPTAAPTAAPTGTPTATPTTGTPTATPTLAPTVDNPGSSLSDGAIAGIVAGVVVFIILVVLIAVAIMSAQAGAGAAGGYRPINAPIRGAMRTRHALRRAADNARRYSQRHSWRNAGASHANRRRTLH